MLLVKKQLFTAYQQPYRVALDIMQALFAVLVRLWLTVG